MACNNPNCPKCNASTGAAPRGNVASADYTSGFNAGRMDARELPYLPGGLKVGRTQMPDGSDAIIVYSSLTKKKSAQFVIGYVQGAASNKTSVIFDASF